METKRIFITGSGSKIGRRLTEILYKEDIVMLLLDRGRLKRSGDPKVIYVGGDITDPASYSWGLEGVDAVVHMAAVTHTNDEKRYHDVNAAGTLNLIKACVAHGVRRFVFVSTRAISVDGGGYSRSKLIAERYVQESGIDWVILRIGEVYGLPDNGGVDALVRYIDRYPFVPVAGDGTARVCPVFIDDVLYAMRQALFKSDIRNRIYTIAGPESYTYNELVDLILRSRHINKPKLHIPVGLLNFMLSASSLFFGDRFHVKDQIPRLMSPKAEDISDARRDLCFNPVRLADKIGSHGRVR